MLSKIWRVSEYAINLHKKASAGHHCLGVRIDIKRNY